MWGQGGRYADWAAFLEKWAVGDVGLGGAPGPLVQEDFDTATWQRLLTRVEDAVEQRFTTWASTLTAALSAASDDFTMGRALTQGRPGLSAIRALTTAPGLPEGLRYQLGCQIDAQIHSLQRNLEDQARRLRTEGRQGLADAYLRVIRDNRVTEVIMSAPMQPSSDNWAAPMDHVRRRIHFD